MIVHIIIWAALAIGCFILAVKGFSKEGMPLTMKRRIKGAPAVVIGVFCLFVGLAFSGMALFLFLDSSGYDPLGFDRKLAEAVDEARTLSILSDIACEIITVQFDTETNPPPEMASFVKWLGTSNPEFLDKSFVDKETGTLRDVWGRELRLIVDKEKVVLGSCGPNGKWEQGNGDDIVGPEIEFYKQ